MEVKQTPIEKMKHVTQKSSELKIQKAIEIAITQYRKEIPCGSKWELIGEISYGLVYRRIDGLFTLEGAHIHEAYLVIMQNKLVGFYLPVEGSFSSLEDPVDLSN